MEDQKAERRRELMEADIGDRRVAGRIDDFYTDVTVTESDRVYLERFLSSSDLEVRREALIGLMFGVKGPKFTGYAIDALILQFLGTLEDTDSQFTGDSVLAELRKRGDQQAITILKLLESNEKWRRRFQI
jgi:hypothetical protein